MATNSNGQAAYLVLDSLSHGSKYGLEIIEYIMSKTNGNFVLKKPTLYSCLSRMEKKGLVSSSFWGESELGGKRHYYTITNSGKLYLSELEVEFANATFAPETEEKVEEKPEISTMMPKSQKPLFYHQDNLFSLAKEKTPEKEKVEEKKSDVVENQIDIFSMPPAENKIEPAQETAKSETRDDAKLLDSSERLTYDQEEQNKRLYDTSNDLKKYRNRKSFSENQIEMAVVYSKAQDEEIQKQRIASLKQSLLNAKNFNSVENKEEEPKQEVLEQNSEIKADSKDDAIFITEPRIDTREIPVQRKITPPNIEIDVTTENLPAPKRNTNLEPTYKDMMSKLFERKKEKKVAQQQPAPEVKQEENLGSFVDYDTLKRYYNGHGIEFKEYHKTSVERIHNTNFLNFISSAFLLMFSCIGSLILFGIIAGAGLLQKNTNFLFYTMPLLFLVYTCFTYICHKVMPSKKASLRYNSVTNWAVFALGCILVLIINIIAGMQYELFAKFLTSLLIPILGILLAFPVNYYIKKSLYKRYAK